MKINNIIKCLTCILCTLVVVVSIIYVVPQRQDDPKLVGYAFISKV